MSRRRLVPLALLVTALLAIVALAARGRPLGTSGGRSGGLPQAFWNYLFTSTVILVGLSGIVGIVAFVAFHRQGHPVQVRPFQARTARTLASVIVAAALLILVASHVDLAHLFHPQTSTATTPAITVPSAPLPKGKSSRPPVHFQWEELAVVLGVLLVLGAVGFVARSRQRGLMPRWRIAPETLAAALDESLDDLRSDPDLRRAIIAAYARMEAALAAAGLPRRPAEAPLEYLERALLTLDTSAAAVRRLTDLFEWARFSQHEPEAAMRDEAVDALVAVRDELRAAEAAVA